MEGGKGRADRGGQKEEGDRGGGRRGKMRGEMVAGYLKNCSSTKHACFCVPQMGDKD